MIAVLLALLLLLTILRVPVLVGIGLVGLVGMAATADASTAFFAQRSFASLDSFSLLALPYFILAGSMMSKGGLSSSLLKLGSACFGHIRGSLGHASIASCVAMANVSGSSTAEAAAIGSVTIPAMKEAGYKRGLAAAIVGAAATIGPVIPPSMTMIIYGSITGVSIGGLFLAGVIPGLLMAATLMTLLYVMSFSSNHPELAGTSPWPGHRAVLRSLRESWVALIAPVIILGGVFSGIFTATEAGIATCLYAFLTSWLYYKTIRLGDLKRILLDAALTTSVVMGIVSMAGSLGWLMSFLEFNIQAVEFIQSISDDGYVVLALIVVSMLALTMFIESLAVLIVFAPTFALVGQAYGFDPFHLGIIIVIATQLGAISPPVAVIMFVTSKIAGGDILETFRYGLVFAAALFALLAVLIFVPDIITVLPSMMAD